MYDQKGVKFGKKKMGMQEQAIKCKISNALLTGSVKSLGYSQLLEFQEFWNMDGFSKISTGNEFYANIRHTINYISNIESILFTILKKPCTVLFTSYSLAWLSNISTCTWNTQTTLIWSFPVSCGWVELWGYHINTGQNKKRVPLEDKWYYWMKMQQKSHIHVNIIWYAAIHFLY